MDVPGGSAPLPVQRDLSAPPWGQRVVSPLPPAAQVLPSALGCSVGCPSTATSGLWCLGEKVQAGVTPSQWRPLTSPVSPVERLPPDSHLPCSSSEHLLGSWRRAWGGVRTPLCLQWPRAVCSHLAHLGLSKFIAILLLNSPYWLGPRFPHALPRVSQHSCPPLLRGVCLFRPHFRLRGFADLCLLMDSRKVMSL